MAKLDPKTAKRSSGTSKAPKKVPRTATKSATKVPPKIPKVVTPEVLDSEELEPDAEERGEEITEPMEYSSSGVPAVLDTDSHLPAVSPKEREIDDDLGPAVDYDTRHMLKQYLKEVSAYPLLTPEEEFSLAMKLRNEGDLDAAKRMVRANLRLVVKIAMEYRSAYSNVLDLIQEGNIGLMKAVSKFDPAKGAKLSYYASWWIRSYILKYLLDNFRLVRVGTTQAQKKLFFHLIREKERLEAQGIEAGPKLLADRLGVREQDVVEMDQRLSGRGAEMSLDHPVGGDSDGESKTTHLDLIRDRAEAPDEALEQVELRDILKSQLDAFSKTLKDKELAVFRERLAAEEPKTLQEVADKFGLTRERARQIEAKVIEKLRTFYEQYIR